MHWAESSPSSAEPGGTPVVDDVQLSSLYQQLILEHYRSPRNRGELDPCSVEVERLNPTCGDQVVLRLQVGDGVIREARFDGEGCSISQAAVSMMTCLLEGATLEEARALADRFTALMHGKEERRQELRQLGDLRALQGVSRFPVRIKCALLGFEALRVALDQVEESGASGA
ncbi:MAG: SUF system NifU family Fe-S cluster assembly protein [Gemmatimonadales bacterium]|nr:MAG: SUF system NifU family Fe-S cluster assembly protein [Gemmatimonadales bacterium]